MWGVTSFDLLYDFIRKHLRLKATPQEKLMDLDGQVTSGYSTTSISLHLMNYMGCVAFIRKHLRLKETPQEILLDLDGQVTSPPHEMTLPSNRSGRIANVA